MGSRLPVATRLKDTLHYYRFLSSVSYQRALLEVLLPGTVLMTILTQYGTESSNNTYLGNMSSIILWAGVGYAIRLQLAFRHKLRHEFIIGLVTISFLSGLLIIQFLMLTPQDKLDNMFSGNTPDHAGFRATVAVVPFTTIFDFFIIRALRYGWRFWNRFRRRKLVWQLIHSHLTLIILVVAIIVFSFFTVVNATNNTLFIPDYVASIPMLLLIITSLTIILSLLILPPLSIVSYIITRRATHRLETLAHAIGTLRTGNYQNRIMVIGEDEVAQLQSDFNMMADELERALRDLEIERDKVTAVLKSRRELFVSISHDLRTPIATMRGYLESISARVEEIGLSDLQEDFAVIERGALHLQRLIDNLFAIARAETGGIDFVLQVTDIKPLLEHITASINPLAWRKSRIKIMTELPPTLPAIQVDSQRLVQIISNLVDNSLKHTPPGGIIIISANEINTSVAIQVRDTGEGIAAEDLPCIWDRFFRATAAQDRKISGTGLGLALVKELTERMGGTVAVESAVGDGTCFTLTFPRVEAS